MNKRFSKQLVGVVALLGASVSYAIPVIPTVTFSVTETSGIANDGLVNVGDSFSILMSGQDFPETGGLTLLVNYNGTVASIKTPAATNGILVAPGSPFASGVITTSPAVPGTQFSILAPNPPAALPSGNFDVAVFNFTADALGLVNFSIGDDGGENVWVDGNTFEPIPVNYNYTGAFVQVIPVPAAAWLFMSAVGGLAALKRRQAK